MYDSMNVFAEPLHLNLHLCDNLSEMLKGLVKVTVPVVKLGVKVGLCGGAVYATKEVLLLVFLAGWKDSTDIYLGWSLG